MGTGPLDPCVPAPSSRSPHGCDLGPDAVSEMCIFSHYRKQIYQTSYNAYDANVDRWGPRVLLAPPPADAHDAHRAIRPPSRDVRSYE